jgi:hypothetical protein
MSGDRHTCVPRLVGGDAPGHPRAPAAVGSRSPAARHRTVSHQVAGRRIGRYPLSALEVAGPWVLAAVPVAGREHSDENAAARVGRFGGPS